MIQTDLAPVEGHPYVGYAVRQTPGMPLRIDLACAACGDHHVRECTYPPKAGAWVLHYAAKHCHGNVALQRHFAEQYHFALQSLRRY